MYRKWSDTTYGPSLLGTRNDYNRLLLAVMEERIDEYPAVKFYCKEIVSKLERIDPYNVNEAKTIRKLANQKEALKMVAYFSEQEEKKLETSRGKFSRFVLFCIGAIGGVIFYGIGFGVIIYLVINLLK
jgi:hypothetical protein